ncbi:MAG: hypothetical protein MI861_14880 [Pirellulales bacterium]|nr:hypothetical protein [Pirellulales bacterium]
MLAVPSELRVDCLDGVLHSHPGPPPDASEFLADSNTRWYEIDAGGLTSAESGLTSVEIRTRRINQSNQTDTLVVRRSATQYRVDASGMSWSSRMLVQVPPTRELPPLVLSQNNITSVKINGMETTYAASPINARLQQILIDLPNESYVDLSSPTTVVVSGKGSWDQQPGWCDLPMPVWLGDQVERTAPVHDVQLAIPDDIQVLAWELPPGWRQTSRRVAGEETVYSAVGPPYLPTETAVSQVGENWIRCRVRLASERPANSVDSLLLLDRSTRPVQARMQMTVAVDPGQVEPIRLQMQRDWSLNSVTLSASGREIELSNLNDQNRSLVIWPEPEDVADSKLVIEAKGSLRRIGDPNVVPPTWFLRAVGSRGDLMVAAIAPADLNWRADTALRIERLQRGALTLQQNEFFGNLPKQSLIFRPQAKWTPTLSLQAPGVTFNVATILQFEREGSEVIESLVIDAEAASQVLPSITVLTGPAGRRPAYHWLLQGSDDAPLISLPESDVRIRNPKTEGEYTIDLSGRNLRERQLIGRRRYVLENALQVQLPSVPKAASQTSEVHLEAGLVVTKNSPSVSKIPVSPAVDSDETPPPADSQFINPVELATRLRYDAVKQPTIEITPSDDNPNVTLVWQESIRVIASSRGTDRIEATYDVSAAGPFEIECDDELQLVAVYRDGEAVDLSSIRQRPISLQPQANRETFRVVWNRNRIGSSWIRGCRVPGIFASGVKIKSEYQLIASSDTFAPAALLQPPGSNSDRAVIVAPGAVTMLVRRNIALAIGWLLAVLVFSLAWYMAQRSLISILGAVVLLVTAACLWWPWHLAIVGWTIVPTITAALLVVATSWSERGGPAQDHPSQNSKWDKSRKSTGSRRRDRSGAVVVQSVVLFLLFVGCLSSLVLAQEASPAGKDAAKPDDVVDVLVPVDKTGKLSGEVVYIPRKIYAELFRANVAGMPREVRFQSAHYRIKIDQSRDSAETGMPPLVQADYLVHLDDGSRQSNLVRLPIAAGMVRRIELVEELNRIVQFQRDSNGQVIAKLPGGNAFHLRLTLVPPVSNPEKWEKIFLAVPPIASARLTVEADEDLAALRVGGPSGRLLAEQNLRRWVEEIGPVDSLEVEFQRPERSPSSKSKPLERRYWLNVSQNQVAIDCEVDPPIDANLGTSVQLVIRDVRLPKLTTRSWTLTGSELVSPTRRLVTLESLADNPGPIRFLWTLPTPENESENESDQEPASWVLEIPEVIAPALGENAEAWIAIESDDEMSVSSTNREPFEPLSVDHFLARWQGRGGKPARALIALDRLLTFELQRKPLNQSRVNQQHQLHVAADHLQLKYAATLHPGDFGSIPRTLTLPPGWYLIDLKINSVSVGYRQISGQHLNEVALGAFENSVPVEIEAHAVTRLPENRQLELPQLTLSPAIAMTEDYLITRSRDVRLQNIGPALVEPVEDPPAISAKSLAQGRIPVARWMIDTANSESAAIGALYRVASRPLRFNCRQLISLSWDAGQWKMDSLIRFTNARIPDYIDVEIPTRWCDSLEVEPAQAWSRQPAIDESFQVVRIHCDAAALSTGVLRIRGQLDDAQKGRVAVPNVKVLGQTRPRIEISVPKRLTNESISWRSSVIESRGLDSLWSDHVASKLERSAYSVTNSDWSVELAPLPPIDADAVALTSDAQVFPQNGGILVVCRWDLIPGGLDSVGIRIPRGAECLGAWTAGTAVSVKVDPEQSDVVRVPLSLSRLAQAVEVFIEVPPNRARQGDYLPRLLDAPASERWLSTFTPGTAEANSRAGNATASERALALARSVVESVDQSFDSLAERPNDEIATWLSLWVARYLQIAATVDRHPDLTSAPLEDQPLLAENSGSPTWEELDARLSVHVRQYLSGDQRQPAALNLAQLEGYTLQYISKISASSPPASVEPVSTRGQGLRILIINGLTLLLVGGLLACLWPARRYAEAVVAHPAFWLGMTGAFGFVVAPLPVAAALILTAVALPAFPYKSRSRTSG